MKKDCSKGPFETCDDACSMIFKLFSRVILVLIPELTFKIYQMRYIASINIFQVRVCPIPNLLVDLQQKKLD